MAAAAHLAPAPRWLLLLYSASVASSMCAMRRLFFFSSRRRHTRLVSDWSSDVCSSDLCSWAAPSARQTWVKISRISDQGSGPRTWRQAARLSPSRYSITRSEERRVGKECRARWSPDHEKKRNRANGDESEYNVGMYGCI